MQNSKLLVASLALVMGATACASTQKTDGPEVTTSTATSRSNAPTLLGDEIMKANVPTAYEAVDRLRRRWWRDVTATSNTVTVYMDNKKLNSGSRDELKEIPAQDVAYLEYLKGSEAVMRFGQDAAGGAIIVHRK